MKHARPDYQHIQDIAEIKIKADEPVFLLRAKDKLAPMTLRHWAEMLEQRSGDQNMIAMVREHAILMEQWQEANTCKLPDFDPSHLSDVPPFILRLHVELAELKARINPLEKFLDSEKIDSISDAQKVLLSKQLDAMTSYKDILTERIADLTSTFK